MFGLFKKKQKTCLGIDLGASGIKLVELVRDNNKIHLANYALAQTKIGSRINLAKLKTHYLADLIKNILDQAGIKSKEAVISLPVGETFSTIIDLPSMSEDELAQAIPYEARKYVPVPIEQIVLDWSIVGEFSSRKEREEIEEKGGNLTGSSTQEPTNKTAPSPNESTPKPPNQSPEESTADFSKIIQVLIVAVPQELIKKIAEISKRINLQILAVEQEAFSIVRALVTNEQEATMIVDIGEESIDLIIFDKGTIRATNTLEKTKPEDLTSGLFKITNLYETRYARKITKLILTGGGVTETEWFEALAQKLKIGIEIGNPFIKLVYNQKLENILKEISPFMTVAIGGAMREI